MGELLSTSTILTSLLLFSCFISSLSFILVIYALIKVLAIEKSTHSVQFMPATPDDPWATPEKDIDELNKVTRNRPVEAPEELIF